MGNYFILSSNIFNLIITVLPNLHSYSLSFLLPFFSASSRRRVFEAEVVEDGSDEEFEGFLESESNDGERGGRGRGRGELEEGDGQVTKLNSIGYIKREY